MSKASPATFSPWIRQVSKSKLALSTVKQDFSHTIGLGDTAKKPITIEKFQSIIIDHVGCDCRQIYRF